MKEIGMKIRELREEKGISPEALAVEVGFAKSTIWAYESGKKQISVSHLAVLADYFKVSTDCLLNREERIIDLDLQSSAGLDEFNLVIDNKPLNRDEIAEAASYIQVKRRMGSYGVVNS